MKSRTSFFNLTALRKDITRFAPVWALYLIGGLLVGLDTIGSSGGYTHSARDLAQTIAPLAIVNLLYAIVTAQMLFGDLFKNRLCNALHAFPLRRESWFVTHTVAGLLFSFVPNLIMSICFLPCLGELWFISFFWLLGMTLEYMFFFGLAAFSAMCTGNRFAMAAVYALINFGSVIAYWFVNTFYAPLLYGLRIRETGFIRLCPSVWLTELELVEFRFMPVNGNYSGWNGEYYVYYDTMMEYVYDGLTDGWWYLAILAVLGIALLGVGLLLYRRRKLESAGDFVAFRWLKPIFSVVFTLSVGALFEMFGEAMMNWEYVFLTVGIVVGYFVGQMLLQRTVRVFRWKAFAACAAIGGALVLSIVLTALDSLGVTRWTPDPDKVEEITLSDSYYYDPYYTTSNVQTITNPELIEELVEIHQQILDKQKLLSNSRDTSSMTIIYKMSDGRQIERRYFYRDSGQVATRLKTFFGAPEFVMGYVDWEDYLSKVSQVHVNSLYAASQWYSGAQAQELLNAIRADCEAGTMDQTQDHSCYYGSVSITYKDGTSRSLSIYNGCENTVAWMKENFI